MWVATAIMGSAVVGGAVQAYSANTAADATKQAALTAANTQMSMYNQTNANLAPYRAIGQTASDQMTAQLPSLTAPISVNPQDFENSDMYKFLQTQGERAVTNSSAARGLGTSGAALKGSAAFETGLNTQQYQQNFNNQVTNQTNAYNRLAGLISTGENASAQTGTAGTAAANGTSQAQFAAGQATSAGIMGTSNAISNAANTAASAVGLYGKNQSTGLPIAQASSPTGLSLTNTGGLY